MILQRELPVWRSLLFVPINVSKYVDKAHTRGADVIQLDLEDSIPESEKSHARTLVAATAMKVRRGGADVVVRINRPLSHAVRDLEHTVCPDVDGIAVTKVESASHVMLLDDLVSEIERKRGMSVGYTKFIAVIETPEAFARISEIPQASARIVAMNIGGEDFALGCCMEPDEDVLLHPKQHMIVAARAAGVMPFGFIGTVSDFGDWEHFRAMVHRSRRFGFDGANCIHPGQVTIVNDEYTPSTEDVAYARKMIELSEEAQKAGRGSFQIEGKMVDAPVVKRAQNLIWRFEAIKRREARKLAEAAL